MPPEVGEKMTVGAGSRPQLTCFCGLAPLLKCPVFGSADISKLLDVLHGFVDAGNTVLVVEHNLEVVKTADWVIDLGPEGGAGGGRVVVAGEPEAIADCKESYTGQALQPLLAGSPSKRTNGRPRRPKRGRPRKRRQRESTEIVIKGASQHNLKDVNLRVPRNRLNVFCGP